MIRLYGGAAVCAVAALVGAAEIAPSGPVSPAGIRATCDIPAPQHLRNTGGIGPQGPGTGAGLCVFTSCELASRWQNVPSLTGFQKWMTVREGGGWPEKLDQMIAGFVKEKGTAAPGYVQHTGGEAEFLELALKTGRMPCVTYAGRDGFYTGLIAHMVNLAHLDQDRAAIIDNNRPGVWVWMTRAEFLDRWRWNQGGWAVVFLDPPPPPYASKPDAPAKEKQPEAGPMFFGVESSKIDHEKRWFLNGKPADRTSVMRAVGSPNGIDDDSGRGWIVAVGDDGFRKKVADAVAALPTATRAKYHHQGYAPDRWEVKAFGLAVGVTVRAPAVGRIGATVGTIPADKFTGAADLVAVIDPPPVPTPPAPIPPPPAPQPDPQPNPNPTPAPNWLFVALAALLGLFLGRRQTPR